MARTCKSAITSINKQSRESYKHFEFSKSNLKFWLGLDAIIMQWVAEWFDSAARPDLQNSDGKSFNLNKNVINKTWIE